MFLLIIFSNIFSKMTFSIEQTLVEQNRHWSHAPYQQHLKRLHDQKVIDQFDLDEIQVVTGIRRCGKSTLLFSLINHLMQNTDPQSILYINFDDPNYTEVCNNASELHSVITTAEKLNGRKIHYLFLDEVQNLNAWEKYVKSSYDSQRFKKITVTGSNADLLNSQYASLLSGRYVKYHLYPLSYAELLKNNKITNLHELIKNKSTALALTDQLLNFGGLPRIHSIQEEEKCLTLLKNYYETILLKDCIANHSVRDTKLLMNLAHYLMTNISSLYSYNSLGRALNTNENTVQNFIQIFQNTYFISELQQFSYSLKTQAKSRKKIYCIDNGLITAVSFKFKNDFGKLFENLIYSELQKTGKGSIYFMNDEKECDFILHNENNTIAIQACYEMNSNNRERELSGLHLAMDKFNIPRGIIITYDQEEMITDTLHVVPFWKYFSAM